MFAFFCAKVEALKRSKEKEEEGRGGQGKRGNIFLLLSSQLSWGTCAETLATQAMSAMLTCLRSSSLCFSNPLFMERKTRPNTYSTFVWFSLICKRHYV